MPEQLTIAGIRARHTAPPPAAPIAPPPRAEDEEDELAPGARTVLPVRQHRRADGYDLAVGKCSAIRVRATREGWTVTSAGHTSRAMDRHQADAMAERVARLWSLP